MNKIITINISGIVFSIDEQAYDMLRQYIERLRAHFKTTDGGNEIINDIEGRIAELLQSRLASGKQFIDDNDVKEVMAVMGDPSQMNMEEEESSSNNKQQAYAAGNSTAEKRLFRNPDDRVLGGVCSGLGAYFGIDSVWVRLGFAFAFFFAGSGLLLYIILWAVIPEAKTVSERLQMKGERVDINNIEKKIKDEFKVVEDKFKDFASNNKPKATNVVQKLVHVLATIIIGFAQILTRILGFFITMFCVGLFVVAVMVLLGVTWPVSFSLYPFFSVVIASPVMLFLAILGFVALIIIPLVYMVYIGIKLLFNISGSNKMFRNISASSFGIGIALFLVSLIYMISQFAHDGEVNKTITLKAADADTLYVNVKAFSTELNKRKVYHAGSIRLQVYNDDAFLIEHVDLKVTESRDGKFGLVQNIVSQGSSVTDAEASAKEIQPQISQHDSGVVLPSGYLLPVTGKYRKQQVTYTLLVPKGKTVVFEDGADAIYGNTAGVSENTTWQMTEKGFTCIKCEDVSMSTEDNSGYYHRNFDMEGFKEIVAEGVFEVNIEQGKAYGVKISASEMDVLNNVLINMNGDKLSLGMDSKFKHIFESLDGEKIVVNITTPELRSLKAKEATKVYVSRWWGNDISISTGGVSEVEIKDVNVKKLRLDMSGASSVELEGSAKELDTEVGGTASLDAEEFKCDNAIVHTSGAAKATVYVNSSMRARASGASRINYKGSPAFKIKNISGAATIEPHE
jgi:phage shock protein PspC (stress-responsive transcriptional regulator)